MHLDQLTKEQKLMAVAVAVVVLYALYVRGKGNAAAAAATSSPGVDVTTPGADVGQLSQDFSSLFSQMKSENDAANQALQGLITDGATNTVQAINSQTAGVVAGLQASNQANQKAIADLQAAQTAGFSGIGSAVNSLGTQLQQLLTSTFGDLTTQMQATIKAITDSTDAMNKLTSSTDGNRDLLYYNLGSQSGASCIGPNGQHYSACLDNKVAFDQLGQWAAGAHDEGYNAIKAAYPDCLNSDGTYNLLCVGQKIAQKKGLVH